MSENILSVIPTDPRWQPGREEGDRARALMARLAAETDRPRLEPKAEWRDTITVADCGANLERIICRAVLRAPCLAQRARLRLAVQSPAVQSPASNSPCGTPAEAGSPTMGSLKMDDGAR